MIINIGVYIAKNLHYCVEIKFGLCKLSLRRTERLKLPIKQYLKTNNEFVLGTIY